jgi:iron complex outermembrane receptor protein
MLPAFTCLAALVISLALAPCIASAEDQLPATDPSSQAESPPTQKAASDDGSLEGAEQQERFSGVENITVTAQKREQTLQEVPAAVSALSGQQLDQSGVTQIQDMSFQIPNMHWGQEDGSAKITIRGVSNAQGTDPATAFHIDGVYQNRAKALTSLTFFDVQRVEVLRGPQGTLYGRNATGGAINVISNAPSQEFELFGDVQFGNYYQKLFRGVLNVPVLDDTLSMRVSTYYEKRDGYQKNGFIEGPTDDADDANDFGLRGQLLLTPTENVDVTARVNYFRKRGVGYGLKLQGPLPDSVELPIIGPIDLYAGATPNPEDPRRVVLDSGGTISNDNVGANLDVVWRSEGLPLIGDTNLRVLGSYVQFDESSFSDQDSSDLFISTLDQNEFNREWVTEVNWGSDDDSTFGWLVGLFHLGTQGTNSIVAPSQLLGLDVGFQQYFETQNYSVAGFVTAWWQIIEPVRIEAGFRYSHDWKNSNAQHPETLLGPITLFIPIDDPRSDDSGRPSGSLTIDWEISDGLMVYQRFATGYKSGALNNDIALLGEPDPVVPPNAGLEDIYSLEWGSKNRLLDDRLFANFTFFVYWYDDLQVSQLFNAQNFIQNAASARSLGIETELTWRPWDPLTLTGQFAYLHSEYTDYPTCLDAKDFSVQDCTGNQLTRAPRLSGSFIAMYEQDLGRYGTLTPFFQVYASDEVFFRPTNEEDDRQGAYAYLNFRLTWRSAREHVGVEAFVDNALDEDVATTKAVGSQLLGAPLLNAYDRPRTIGIRLTLDW